MSSQVLSSVDATGLFQLIEDEDWGDAILQIKECPEEAKTWVIRSAGKSKFRRLPLHEALMRKAPGEVVECLLTANRDASKACDDTGRLPLHHAIFNGAEMKVVTKLVMEYPESLDFVDKGGLKPLGIAMLGSSTEKENLVAFLSKGSVFYAVQKEENKWVQREHDLKKEFENKQISFEAKAKEICFGQAEEIKTLTANVNDMMLEHNSNKATISDLQGQLEILNCKHMELLLSNIDTTDALTKALAQNDELIAAKNMLEAELAAESLQHIAEREQHAKLTEETTRCISEKDRQLEHNALMYLELSLDFDNLKNDYNSKTVTHDEAVARIESLSAEANQIIQMTKDEAAQRIIELENQVSTLSLKCDELLLENETKTEGLLSEANAKEASLLRIVDLEEQLSSCKAKYDDLFKDYEAKISASDAVALQMESVLVEKAADEQKMREEFERFVTESTQHSYHLEEQLVQTKSAFNEAVTELEIVKSEKQTMKNELEERVVDLEQQVATFSIRCDELLQENAVNKQFSNDHATQLQITIDMLSEEKVDNELKAIESTQRILDLEQQLSASSLKYSELSLDYNRKAQACDDAVARLEKNLLEKAALMSELEALAAQSSKEYAKFSLDYTAKSEKCKESLAQIANLVDQTSYAFLESTEGETELVTSFVGMGSEFESSEYDLHRVKNLENQVSTLASKFVDILSVFATISRAREAATAQLERISTGIDLSNETLTEGSEEVIDENDDQLAWATHHIPFLEKQFPTVVNCWNSELLLYRSGETRSLEEHVELFQNVSTDNHIAEEPAGQGITEIEGKITRLFRKCDDLLLYSTAEAKAVVEAVEQLATYAEKMKKDFVEVTRSENQEAEKNITLAYDDAVQEYRRLANQKENQIAELEENLKVSLLSEEKLLHVVEELSKMLEQVSEEKDLVEGMLTKELIERVSAKEEEKDSVEDVFERFSEKAVYGNFAAIEYQKLWNKNEIQIASLESHLKLALLSEERLKHTVEELTAMLERTSEEKDFVEAMLAKALQSEEKHKLPVMSSSSIKLLIHHVDEVVEGRSASFDKELRLAELKATRVLLETIQTEKAEAESEIYRCLEENHNHFTTEFRSLLDKVYYTKAEEETLSSELIRLYSAVCSTTKQYF